MAIQSPDVRASALIAEMDDIRQSCVQDETKRKALYDAARALAFAIETPGDAINRIAYSVRAAHQYVCGKAGS